HSRVRFDVTWIVAASATQTNNAHLCARAIAPDPEGNRLVERTQPRRDVRRVVSRVICESSRCPDREQCDNQSRSHRPNETKISHRWRRRAWLAMNVFS